MRHRVAVWAGMVACAALLAGGCAQDANQLRADNLRLDRELRDLSSRYAELNAQTGNLQGQLEVKNDEIDRQRAEAAMLQAQVKFLRDELAKVPGAEEELPDELREALEALQRAAPELLTLEGAVVRLKADILFASGRHQVRDEGTTALRRFAEIFLEKGIGFRLRIDGHTDNEPIDRSRERYDDNWDLSYERAHAVLQLLAEVGIPEDQMFVMAFGEFSPRAPNDTRENKQLNRRVDILLMSREMSRTMALQ